MTPWDISASIFSTLTGAAMCLLGIGCLWPMDRPHRTTHPRPRCQLRPIRWPAEWTCTPPEHPFTLTQAHRWMQLHRDHDCPRKHAAFTALVAAGRITPDSARHRRRP
jgi:hypothetical protein